MARYGNRSKTLTLFSSEETVRILIFKPCHTRKLILGAVFKLWLDPDAPLSPTFGKIGSNEFGTVDRFILKRCRIRF